MCIRDRLAGGASALTDVAASDTLSVAEIRKAVRTLKKNKALKYTGRFAWMAKVQPDTSYDLSTIGSLYRKVVTKSRKLRETLYETIRSQAPFGEGSTTIIVPLTV